MGSVSFRGPGRMDTLLAEVKAEFSAQQLQRNDDWQRQFDLQVSELYSMRQRFDMLERKHKSETADYQNKLHNCETTIYRLKAELALQGNSPSNTGQANRETTAVSHAGTTYETAMDWADTNPDLVPSQYKLMDIDDWYAVFNPHVPRRLDISLRYTISFANVVCCVRFSADGRYLATASHQMVQIFDVHTRTHYADLIEYHKKSDGSEESFIRSLCFSPDGRYLATASEDKIIRIWDVYQQKMHKRLVGHTQEIYGLEYANNHIIVSGSRDATVRVWDVHTGTELFILSTKEGISSVSISPDTDYIAASCQDSSIHIWNRHTGDRVALLQGGPDGHTDSTYCVSFLPGGKELVSGSLDQSVKCWQLRLPDAPPGSMAPPPSPAVAATQQQSWRLKMNMNGHKDYVVAVGVTPDARWVISGSKDRNVRFWDAQTGETQCVLHGHNNTILSVAASRDYFTTGGGDKVVRLWAYSSSGIRGATEPV